MFQTIARLTERGVAIVYISHRMKEVQMLGDRITILRDGTVVTSLLRGAMSQVEMVGAMIGRASGSQLARTPRAPGTPILFAAGVGTAKLSDISIEIRAGEVVGLAGLVGSGRTEVVRALFGADPITSGEVVWLGSPAPRTLDARVRAGMALLPEDRKQEGPALALDIRDNATIASLWRSFTANWFSTGHRRARHAQADRAAGHRRPSARARPSAPSVAATSRRSCWRSGLTPAADVSCWTNQRAASMSAPRPKSIA